MEQFGSSFVGAYVIVRCKEAGVHAGYLVACEGRSAHLRECRRLWYWKPAGVKKFLSGVAAVGLDPASKLGTMESEKLLTETCEITRCSAEAERSIRMFPDDDR